ncbi:glutamic acid-rich protein isoform X2 [Parambassis ranga]|uniref:Glutamic acid-rich protein isoform X2 n=1 Tax=Parambassis ranga TaxID=210632 RepID=A0A6P7J7C9_9TELE|nr:glutamic acid-rich protein-like isoform X2 [Parambassis ranga]
MEVRTDYSTLQSHQHLRVMHLQQRWLELKEREHIAQQHNRQLLQQFDQAQETLKEMLACNAAMKTIRMEYERYLKESTPRWQQQLKEKTQAAQKKRTEDYLRSYLNNREDGRVKKSYANQPLPSQGPATRLQNTTAPQGYADYNQGGPSHLPYPQSSWLTQSQSLAGRFPIRAPHQLHSSSPVPPSFHPTPFFPHPLHNLTSTPGPHQNHHWHRQGPPGWASTQSDYFWPYAAEIPSDSKALWGQLYMDEPPSESRASQTVVDEGNMSSKRERSHLSQELDVKPVRLTGGHTDSSESGRDSSLASREKRVKREKRGRQHASSSEERCTSEETSSAIVIPSGRVTKSPDSDAMSTKGCTSSRKTRRSEEFTVLSPKSEKVAKEKSKRDDSESQRPVAEELLSSSEESMSKKLENESRSEMCGEESGSQREDESGRESTKNEHGVADEMEAQESSTEEEEEERQKHLGAGEDDEKKNTKKGTEQQDRDVEHDEDGTEITTEEEEEAAAEDKTDQGDDEEQSDKVNNKEQREQDSSYSEDEEVNEDVDKEKIEEDEEQEEKIEEDEEQESEEEEAADGSDEPGEDRDSDDSIISPQQRRSKQMQIILEEASEDDEQEDKEEEDEEGGSEEEQEGSSKDSSNEFSEDDNIENLLAPQEQMTKKDLKANEKPKASIFQVEQDGLKTDQQSDSDEFDHFYD